MVHDDGRELLLIDPTVQMANISLVDEEGMSVKEYEQTPVGAVANG